MKPRRDPVIELEPRNPFSWKIALVFGVAWIGALIAVIVLKRGVIRLLLPAIAAGFVIYLAVCIVVYFRNRR